MEIVQSEMSGFTIRSTIPSIRSSLKHHAEVFQQLCYEMHRFSGLNEDEKVALRNSIKDTFKNLSEHSDFDTLIEEHFRVQSELRYVFGTRFGALYMVHAIPMVLLSCSLAEALINSLGVMGLVKVRKDKLVPIFDRMEIKDKWRLGPSLFSDEIEFDLGSHVFSELKELVDIRNAFMHNKMEIASSDGKHKFKESPRDRLDMSLNGRKRLLKFADLPDRLCDFVLASVSDVELRNYLETASFR